MIGVCKYTQRNYCPDWTGKHIWSHFGTYSLKQCNNMKALQNQNATTSARDMHKAKGRKRDKGQDCEHLSSHRTCDETWVLHSLAQSGHKLDLSGGGGSLQKMVGENPQNIKTFNAHHSPSVWPDQRLAITHPELTPPCSPKHSGLHKWGNVWSHYPLSLQGLTVCRWIEWTKPVHWPCLLQGWFYLSDQTILVSMFSNSCA